MKLDNGQDKLMNKLVDGRGGEFMELIIETSTDRQAVFRALNYIKVSKAMTAVLAVISVFIACNLRLSFIKTSSFLYSSSPLYIPFATFQRKKEKQ